MTDHDPLCPQHLQYPGHRSRCICVLLREADARARADEQERNGFGHVDELEHDLAHAEAVAAKLVEVICERDERVGYWHRRWDFAQGQMDAMGASLLAARAEVAALRERYTVEEFIDTDGYPSIRVIKAIERVDENEWAMIIRREVLADLRAEVLGLEHEDECVTRWQPRDLRRKKRPCDCLIADVITKIEEAGR